MKPEKGLSAMSELMFLRGCTYFSGNVKCCSAGQLHYQPSGISVNAHKT